MQEEGKIKKLFKGAGGEVPRSGWKKSFKTFNAKCWLETANLPKYQTSLPRGLSPPTPLDKR